MARPTKTEAPWYQRVAEIMVREQKSIAQAAMEAGVGCTSEDLNHIGKLKSFQKVLWTERHRFYSDLARDPDRTKTSLIGQMMYLVQKLIEEGEYDKALEGALKLAKVDGLIGPENQVNIFGGITPADLEKAKEKLAKQLGSGGSTTQGLGQA